MHPVIEAAGRNGELPAWARLSALRRQHVERVAELLGEWGRELGLSDDELVRWRAAGRLHDALKDETAAELRKLAGETGWPEPLLHAPAAAARLAEDGVDDEELVMVVRYHPVGHPDFGALGLHLYLADYLEPGRNHESRERARLRDALPGALKAVLPHVIRARIGRQLSAGHGIVPESVAFWNRVVDYDGANPAGNGEVA